MSWQRTLCAALVLCALCGRENASLGAVRRVPSEYSTIQEAIDASADGDTVLVADGTYTGDGNYDIDFLGKGLTIRSEKGPESCIIDCGGLYPAYAHWPLSGRGTGHRGGDPVPLDYHRAFYLQSHQAGNTVVEGLTVTGGVAIGSVDAGGAFYCRDSHLTIRDCIIISNAAGEGGGIYARDCQINVENCIITENVAFDSSIGGWGGGGVMVSGGEAYFSNCLIVGNVASQGAGGVSCGGDHQQFVNCTVAGNRAHGTGASGGMVFWYSQGLASYLINSIISDNVGTDVAFQTTAVWTGGGIVESRCSLIGADPSTVNDFITGQWITGDPLFVSSGYWDPNGTPEDPSDDFWVDGDYHLKSQGGRWDPAAGGWVQDDVTSPCIDAGDPNSPIMYEPFPNGGVINIGVYGGTAEASKSYFGEPVCETIVAGDINGDCKVDIDDLLLLMSHWTEE